MNFDLILKNYFSYNSENKQTFQDWLLAILVEAFKFLNSENSSHIHGNLLPQEVSKLFREQDIPEFSNQMDTILKQVFDDVVENSVRISQPSYIGHMTQVCPNFSLLCDFIISFLNQNNVKIETALCATYIEWQTISWLHKLIYNQPENYYNYILDHADASIGNMCSGGTLANLTALVVARNEAFPDLNKIGIVESFKKANCERAVILVSSRGHYSIKKAMSVMGLGEQNVIEIPCELFTNKIDLEKLKEIIKTLVSEKVKIISIVGVAGSTETGSVDDLISLSKICKENKIWFHVDAAWGGALLLSKKYLNLLDGIDQADSVSIDGHKFLYLTISHSMVLFKNQHSLNHIRHSANYIIREGSVDLGRTSIEGSRRFDSFKLWFSLKILGRQGYELLINSAIEKGEYFSHLIEHHENFELTSQHCTGILTYRFIPKELKNKSITKSQNLILNKINTEIQKKQRAIGQSFVSRTILETIFLGQKIVILRALPINPLTNELILTEILAQQSEIGKSLLEEEINIANIFIST